MKTSNKILIAFTIFVFSVPVIMLAGFRNGINKKEFTVKKDTLSDSYEISKGRINSYKVIKIVGGGVPEVFSCNIYPADSASFSYTKFSESDIKVDYRGDTLLVSYGAAGRTTKNDHMTENSFVVLHVDLFLPVLNKVIIERANVAIDSVDMVASPDISFNLYDRASLQFCKAGHNKSVFVRADVHAAGKDSMIETSGMLNKVEIKAINSTLWVGRYAWVKDLRMQLDGVSKLAIESDSRIDQMSGFVSDSSTVEANWKNIRRVAVLTGK